MPTIQFHSRAAHDVNAISMYIVDETHLVYVAQTTKTAEARVLEAGAKGLLLKLVDSVRREKSIATGKPNGGYCMCECGYLVLPILGEIRN